MKKINILLILFATLLTSCIDPIEIDPQDGPKLIGINGHITNEYKKHLGQLTITKTVNGNADAGDTFLFIGLYSPKKGRGGVNGMITVRGGTA